MKSFNIRLETVHFPHLICSFCLMKTLCTFLPCKTVFFLFHSSVFESCVLCSNPRKQNIHHLPRRGCKDVYELYQKLVTSVHLLTLFMFDVWCFIYPFKIFAKLCYSTLSWLKCNIFYGETPENKYSTLSILSFPLCYLIVNQQFCLFNPFSTNTVSLTFARTFEHNWIIEKNEWRKWVC